MSTRTLMTGAIVAAAVAVGVNYLPMIHPLTGGKAT